MSMIHKSARVSRAVLLAAAVGLSALLAPAARADSGGLTISPIYTDGEGPSPLLTTALNDARVGHYLTDMNIKVGGYAQASWTMSFSNPPGDIITGRGLDFENQDLTLNGVGLFVERGVDASQKKFEVGFRVDVLYGGDARFTHSNGILDNKGFVFNATRDQDTGPDEQLDLTQAFIEVAVPWGNGLTLNIGKFITPIGYEYVDPTKNTLYSHGYLFNFGAPFSQTGITAKYSLTPEWIVMAGVTRGWDQSTKDNNSAVDFIGSIEYKPTDSAWDTSLTLSTGPQGSFNYGYRTEVDALIYYTPAESKWSGGAEIMYGIEADAPSTGEDYSQWYGAAIYKSYAACGHISVNSRAEWFNDSDGVRGVGANNVYEITLGVTLMPLADNKAIGTALKIRPEIRFDYADQKVFDDFSQRGQTTFAIDAVLAF